ncbi:MAG: energy-coupling factor transporter transmembrane protein EcfT [Aigarchaeota archaeon]|nr:energy-coupling factor transporter transmembrane protein EcfT [Aigarchaeota archaeon]MCX8193506.1 energy-coupling factor transporter transmembrane protein EcfT [Nitrososphaeria archaeon]MDW7986809.1 energy-coupling factor transporter transmembrane component T [Nitrososphaerota archaeon]
MRHLKHETSDQVRLFLESSSKINPIVAQAIALIVLTAISSESNLLKLFTILITSLTVSLIFSRKLMGTLRFMLFFTPFSIGLGLFYSFISGRSLIESIVIMWMKVGALISISTMLYYCVDPWELAGSLASYLKFPKTFAYTIGVAFSMYQKMLKDLKEGLDSLRSKRVIKNWLDYLIKLDKIFYVLLYAAYKRAEDMEIVLESRSFDPEKRRERKKIKIRLRDLVTLLAVSMTIIITMFIL